MNTQAFGEPVSFGVEYYGSTGAIAEYRRLDEQVHIPFPSADILSGGSAVLNLSLGFGLTGAGEKLTLKWRLGCRF